MKLLLLPLLLKTTKIIPLLIIADLYYVYDVSSIILNDLSTVHHVILTAIHEIRTFYLSHYIWSDSAIRLRWHGWEVAERDLIQAFSFQNVCSGTDEFLTPSPFTHSCTYLQLFTTWSHCWLGVLNHTLLLLIWSVRKESCGRGHRHFGWMCLFGACVSLGWHYISITLHNFQRIFSTCSFIWSSKQPCEPWEDNTNVLKVMKLTTREVKGLLKGHRDYLRKIWYYLE